MKLKTGQDSCSDGCRNLRSTLSSYFRIPISITFLELDELPVLASKSSARTEPGMTLAIEPKIFFPGRGGVGIENMYLIIDTGFEKLTPFSEDIIYC